MDKRSSLFAFTVVLVPLLLAACGVFGGTMPNPPAGSSGKGIPLYSNAETISLSEADRAALMADIPGDRSDQFQHTESISWSKDTGVKVRDQLDHTLPDQGWRVADDWSSFGDSGSISTWRNGDLYAQILILDNLGTENLNALSRRYGIKGPLPGSSLIVMRLWDSSRTSEGTATPATFPQINSGLS